jgi:hypothetical protein
MEVWYVPAGQRVQLVRRLAPCTGWYVPARHMMQDSPAEAPVAVW